MTSPPTVESPCIRNCCLDEANVCMGCGRTLEEIVRWSQAPDAEKTEILRSSRARRARRGLKETGGAP
jgi:predicted Fe-S protein YdhL (DUF1289 family)